MRKTRIAFAAASVAALTLVLAVDVDAKTDWSPVAEVLGKKGWPGRGGTYKVTLLREEPTVKSGLGMFCPPQLGLNSYAAFAGDLEDATVVGDTCMLSHEINPAIDALRAGGIEVVALHNHMVTDEPRLFFMHFQGRGKALALARAIRSAWNELGKPKPPAPKLPDGGRKAEPDWKSVSRIIREEGARVADATWKFSFLRNDLKIELDGRELPAAVGLGCWAAFFACPCGLTKVMGDTCVRRSELQGVLDALRKNGIHISAIHNHLFGTSDPLMFVHIEAEGDALAIARGVRAAWKTLGR